ncbi:DNA (cytosine-5)-methyltransferase DRM2-like [Triticum dicoccoides]|uniref:DNA (cytosine-5)-methyltransferase DRM2-like n=1 Tax=Triticum dicoccoides TaxID=85692 RepID=UPI00188F4DC5|nr:DNA (cytosine-5)-methyltransferase DRM2-like [Triticum dicoccoides]
MSFSVYLGDALVSWSSQRQATVSRFNVVAEYHGVTNNYKIPLEYGHSRQEDTFHWMGIRNDSDGRDKGKSDVEYEPSWAPDLRNLYAPGPSTLGSNGWANGEASSPSLVKRYVAMGFPKEMVVTSIKEIGHSDQNALLELLLTYKAIGDEDTLGNISTSGCALHRVEDGDDLHFESSNGDDDAGDTEPNFGDYSDEDFVQEMFEKDEKINSLVDMGFSEDEANMAIIRCGVDGDLSVLVDSISASRVAGNLNLSNHQVMGGCFDSFGGRKKARLVEERKKKRKRCGCTGQSNQPSLDCNHDEDMLIPNPMVGFNLPNYSLPLVRVTRRILEQDMGPPYFYYENVARAPTGVWATISRSLYDIQPEFVDSKHLCATARKRGYIHNLPIENRAPLLPSPPMTIFEAFPRYKKWWPSWDQRTQFNCLLTGVAGPKLTGKIGRALASADTPPSQSIQKYVIDHCKRYNLVWVGKNKVAKLEPQEIEYLLGFPKDHTRGLSDTNRYKSLGNSFHVDTVAYHLSVLKGMFPNGVNVLSLFTGIGGGEVALHRLGINMRTVVSVEIDKASKRIFRDWWNQTQTGTLIEIDDVKSLTDDQVATYVTTFGGFDLVIGGSPCNNLAGCNRSSRHGLEGKQSVLFHHYVRILNAVKSAMARK